MKRSNRPNSPTRLTFLPIIKRKKFSIFLSISFIQPNWAFIDFGAEEICYFFSVHRLVIDASVPVRWYYFHRDRAVSCYFFAHLKRYISRISLSHWRSLIHSHIFLFVFRAVLCCAMLWKTDCNSKDQHMYIYTDETPCICNGVSLKYMLRVSFVMKHYDVDTLCSISALCVSWLFFSSFLRPYMHIKTIVYYTRLQYNVSKP